ncbi:hypothetical protein HOLleu_33721 [Holothuria leucospilota]|uniref:Endonuclease/exonuclease/phosphatase domain-containing protein n=1 Tax=Holothuria leucospilota TaxID=206669 RepID=A0A9Q1BGU5_HOLLE|nr:hypothetical protein HOLleu_33721 [Holothuria leucospilota]
MSNNYTRNLFLGDFNAKHPALGHDTTNRNGNALAEIANTHGLILLNDDTPTYYSNQGTPGVLDLALCSQLLSPSLFNFSVLQELSSDHLPFLINSISPLSTSTPGPYKLANTKNYNHTDWKAYTDALSLPPDPPLQNTADIDALVETLTLTIRTALDNNTPDPKPPPTHTHCTLPGHILAHIRNKNRLRKDYQRTRNPATKRLINRLTNDIKRLIQNHSAQRWEHACNQINDNTPPQIRWKIFKRLTGNAKKTPYPTLVSGNTFARTDPEKANLFNLTMDNIQRDLADPNFNPHTKALIDRVVALNNNALSPLPQIPPEPPPNNLTTPFTPLEVYQALKLRKNTSPGTDGIPFKALKLGPPPSSTP